MKKGKHSVPIPCPWALAVLLITIPMLILSCAGNQPVVIYRSNGYMLYRLQHNDTQEKLAGRYLGHEKSAWLIEKYNRESRFRTGDFIVIPLAEKNMGGISGESYQAVPILCYHKLKDRCSSPLCMPSHLFQQQMKYLKENGYKTLSPEELLGFLEYRHPIPPNSVLITIDDGYRSTYDVAYPILMEYGLTATLFIYTDYVGHSKNALTWSHLREMKRAGFAIGSHSVSHRDLTGEVPGESEQANRIKILKELAGSKKILDEALNQDTIFLAFPFGNYNYQALNIARETGYKLAVSVEKGNNPFFSNPLALKRIQIFKRDLQSFIQELKTYNRIKE